MIEFEYHWQGLALLALALASVPLWFPRFDLAFASQVRRWMGFIGGVATGYVVLYMLPKIARITMKLIGIELEPNYTVYHLQMYFLLLLAIILYLIMMHLNTQENRWNLLARSFDYLVHGAYHFLVGYVFVEVSSAYMDVNLLIALILGLHLMGMNHILRSTRAAGFDSWARWLYSGLILLGAGLGLATELPEAYINGVTAFLAGIILVNVISEELPLHYRNRVPWYLGGIAFFITASVLIITYDPRLAY